MGNTAVNSLKQKVSECDPETLIAAVKRQSETSGCIQKSAGCVTHHLVEMILLHLSLSTVTQGRRPGKMLLLPVYVAQRQRCILRAVVQPSSLQFFVSNAASYQIKSISKYYVQYSSKCTSLHSLPLRLIICKSLISPRCSDDEQVLFRWS